MRRQRSSTYNEADEAEQRRLERHPEFGHAGAVLVGARLASDGDHLPNGLPVASAWPFVGPQMATAACGTGCARHAQHFGLQNGILDP